MKQWNISRCCSGVRESRKHLPSWLLVDGLKPGGTFGVSTPAGQIIKYINIYHLLYISRNVNLDPDSFFIISFFLLTLF